MLWVVPGVCPTGVGMGCSRELYAGGFGQLETEARWTGSNLSRQVDAGGGGTKGTVSDSLGRVDVGGLQVRITAYAHQNSSTIDTDSGNGEGLKQAVVIWGYRTNFWKGLTGDG